MVTCLIHLESTIKMVEKLDCWATQGQKLNLTLTDDTDLENFRKDDVVIQNTYSEPPVFNNNGFSSTTGRPITNVFNGVVANPVDYGDMCLPVRTGYFTLDFGNKFADALPLK